MKKLENIELQGTHFPIEQNAYAVLEKYLKSIRKHFSTFDDSEEIIDDLECRIAEKFSTEILTKRHKTVTLKDVNTIIDDIGKVEDMGGKDEEDADTPTPARTKKFYRSTDSVLIGGVAGGIAQYLNIDVTIVRLLFLLSMLLGGYTLILYVILWLITPEAKTETEKMQMRGDAITLEKLEKNIASRLGKMPEQAQKVRDKTQSFVGNQSAIQKLMKLAIQTLGFCLFLGSIIALCALFFGLLFVFFSLNHPYVDPAVGEVAHTLSEPWIIPTLFSSIFLIGALPLWGVLLIGKTLMQWKRAFGLPTIITTIVLWISSIAITSILAAMFVPTLEAKVNEIVARRDAEYQASIIVNEYNFKNFDSIEISEQSYVTLHQGEFKVKVSGDKDFVSQIEVVQDKNNVFVKDNHTIPPFNRNCWIGCSAKTASVEIWLPDLKKLVVKDSASVVQDDGIELLSTVDTTITLEDSSYLSISLNTPNLNLSQTDSARSTIQGVAQTVTATLTDSSLAELQELATTTATVNTSDSSEVLLKVSDALKANASGNSMIRYSGNPSTLERLAVDDAVISSLYTREDNAFNSAESM